MKAFNIYLIGVGGQGIGLLSEAIIKAVDLAGIKVRGVDTHGLAQRGGTVSSHIRMGDEVYSPLNRRHQADLLIALERHEALRAINQYAGNESTLVYYDAVWQPLNVRLGKEKQVETAQVAESCVEMKIREFRVFIDNLSDSRMQNVALLACIARNKLIPGVGKEHYIQALKEIMEEKTFQKNMDLFESLQ